MRFSVDRIIIGFFVFAFILVSITSVFAQNEILVDSTNLTVFRDGLIHFSQKINVNETDPAITLPLFSSVIDNLIVTDENQKVLDYNINEANFAI